MQEGFRCSEQQGPMGRDLTPQNAALIHLASHPAVECVVSRWGSAPPTLVACNDSRNAGKAYLVLVCSC